MFSMCFAFVHENTGVVHLPYYFVVLCNFFKQESSYSLSVQSLPK